MIEIVSATRLNQQDFWNQSALGFSLGRLSHDKRLVPRIFFENSRGLSDIFNECLQDTQTQPIVVFVHDDVWLNDFFVADRILEAAKVYDVFGVVGNKRQLGLQPSWAFLTTNALWDDAENFSGSVCHSQQPFGAIDHFGPSPADCALVDGLFIGVNKAVVNATGTRFDPAFKFHFYDVDFCMVARKNGLKIGTWPIALTHQSMGGFDQSWRDTYQVFTEKWQGEVDDSIRIAHLNAIAEQRSIQPMKQTPAHNLINPELMAMIPDSASCIVDVGCMHGQMAQVYKPQHPDVKYIGIDIDIDPDYAAIAAQHCDEAFAADIETLSDEDFASLFPSDCWVFGDCLEHLKDPWSVLRRVRSAISPDGCVLVCIPNAQHWSVQFCLMSGQFRYQDSGLLDRTHLRWFTRTTLLEMFRDTGWAVAEGLTRTLPASPQQAQALEGLRAFALECGLDPEFACNDAQPFQYIFKLIPDLETSFSFNF